MVDECDLRWDGRDLASLTSPSWKVPAAKLVLVAFPLKRESDHGEDTEGHRLGGAGLGDP